ncbi:MULTISPECIES: 30S ribosomal protein S4 [Denitromonas]|uniref:Small ribosomal subunit protein uS4 n=2 Tax=Denitromonas TaxID=139331 RepID=A0A558EUR5_9RHOO|nr:MULTISPECIES: 30S ribosomal protein S4 [Denitromonas]TVO59316.1 30S ribosomal protein S4 [Denitromonas halophila]TVO68797.1 30S ribosomal protein S4 [Denitromonas ohlonensis]TVO72837.1 30S ribosomal protein S4 [Denitromonas ohlonensis]TVT49577.1 MAG: 30S ribosomal protein S4 [Denitromonas halophila]TVT75271.1 MAG: 30S ribosomal protein S4 [Denitromonas halophila]
MSRFTGPRLKVMRALGTELPGLSRKSISDRPHPPGQHGARNKHRKSDYGLQLIEKQKLRFNYGLTETQIRRLFREAKRDKGPTGDKLLELLECRIDNAVFRAGFAPTGIAARQLVRHRHVLLNGRSVNIPSIRVRVGDVITLTAKARQIGIVSASLAEPALTRPEWLGWNDKDTTATVMRLPEPDEVPFPVNVQDVVEYYAVRM